MRHKLKPFCLAAALAWTGAVSAAAPPDIEGSWRCRLLFRYTEIEANYRSHWTFAAGVALVRWDADRATRLRYRWLDGRRLRLDRSRRGADRLYAEVAVSIDAKGQLVLDDPASRWKGWVCVRRDDPVA